MLFAVLALAALAPPAQELNDGDAIAALAWQRVSKGAADAATACVEASPQTTAEQIRQPTLMLGPFIAKDDSNQRPNPARLRRIARGEGGTLAFDVKRLGLPAPSPACKNRYWVSAPVRIDDVAYVDVGMVCGSLCGHGEVLLLERRGGAWQVAEQIAEWWS